MKKILFYLSVLFFISSCSNNEIGIKYQLTTVVDGTDLVANLINPYDKANFFPDGKVSTNFNVRTTYLIYDNGGSLIDQKTLFSESFFTKNTFSNNLDAGTYTVISIMDIIYNNADFDWTIKDLTKLSTANITTVGKVPSQYGILGYHKELITITNQGKKLSMIPQHIGALYVIHIDNVDYSKIRYVYYKFTISPDTYQISTNNASTINTYYYDNKWDNQGIYTGYYDYAYLLPNFNLNINYERYDTNNKSIDNGLYTISQSIVAGNHQVLNIDISQNMYNNSALSRIKSNINILNIARDKSISINKLGYSTCKTK